MPSNPFSRWLLTLFCMATPLAAQNYVGTLTYDGANLTSSVLVSIQLSGSRITGSFGLGATGQTPKPSLSVTGTYANGICTVTANATTANFVLTGPCNGTTFSGTYKAGVQTGRFTTSAGGSAPPPPQPIPQPAPQPVPQPAPAQTLACIGYMHYDAVNPPNTYPELTTNLQLASGRISGYVGIGQPNQPAPASIPASGSYNGSTCSLTLQGGMTWTGQCSAAGFIGRYSVSTNSGIQNGDINIQCGRGYQPPTPAPVPQPQPQPTPQPQHLNCVGSRTFGSNQSVHPYFSAQFQISGGNISGIYGFSPAVPSPLTQATGTYNGSACTVAIGTTTYTGMCNASSWSGTFSGPTGTSTDSGVFSVGCGNAAPPPNPPMPTPYQPSPTPQPQPQPQPTPPGTQSFTCNGYQTFRQYPTYNPSVIANLQLSGGRLSGTFDLPNTTVGRYVLSGSINGSNCSLVTTSGITYTGICATNNITGTFRGPAGADYDSGVFTLGCNGNAPPPAPPLGPSQPPQPQPQSQPQPQPQPQPISCQGTRTFGENQANPSGFNASLNLSSGRINGTLGIAPQAGSPVASNISVTGTYTGSTCTVTLYGATYSGTCTGSSWSGTFRGATGTGGDSGVFSLGCGGAAPPPNPAMPAAYQPRTTPAPTPQPQSTPAPSVNLACQGTHTFTAAPSSHPTLNANLVASNGQISGSIDFGIASVGRIPVSGSISGSTCSFHTGATGIDANQFFTGSCTTQGIYGTFHGDQNNANDSGTFSIGCNGNPPPQTTPAPNQNPNNGGGGGGSGGNQTPQPPQPNAPAQKYQKYCGTLSGIFQGTNMSNAPISITMGGGISGTATVTPPQGANITKGFSYTWSNTACNSTATAFAFNATCNGSSISGFYTAGGAGSFTASTAGCNGFNPIPNMGGNNGNNGGNGGNSGGPVGPGTPPNGGNNGGGGGGQTPPKPPPNNVPPTPQPPGFSMKYCGTLTRITNGLTVSDPVSIAFHGDPSNRANLSDGAWAVYSRTPSSPFIGSGNWFSLKVDANGACNGSAGEASVTGTCTPQQLRLNYKNQMRKGMDGQIVATPGGSCQDPAF